MQVEFSKHLSEDLDAIIERIAEGCRAGGGIEGQTFERVPDRGSALARAVALARPGDVVIACGKGHEQSMCFGETEYSWDDINELRLDLQHQHIVNTQNKSEYDDELVVLEYTRSPNLILSLVGEYSNQYQLKNSTKENKYWIKHIFHQKR